MTSTFTKGDIAITRNDTGLDAFDANKQVQVISVNNYSGLVTVRRFRKDGSLSKREDMYAPHHLTKVQ